MVTATDLKNQIEALKEAGLVDAAKAKEAELEKMVLGGMAAPVAAPVAATVVASAGTAPAVAGAKSYSMDVGDKEAFDRGGDQFGAPDVACVIPGKFLDIVTPDNKPENRWWLFKPDGCDYTSAITVAYGKGAFKLKELLMNLGIEWAEQGTNISFSIAAGYPCMLDYGPNTYDGKTSIRLNKVYKAGTDIQQAI